jgi:nucleoside-diphosphate kinase
VKPDGVQRGLVGEVISRFERKGYKLVALKLVHPTAAFAEEHYKDLSKKPFFPGLVKYFSSGPVAAMVWEGRGVIKGGRVLVGATNPAESAPGSIRGDFCIEVLFF